MKFGLARAALLSSVIAWIVPVLPSGPWAVTSVPPALESAPGFMVLGTDTLRLSAGAWRDYMPKVVSALCGGVGPNEHELRLVITFQPEQIGFSPPAVDSVWLVHRTTTVVDAEPSWSSIGGRAQLRYETMPVWAQGDSFTVLVAVRGLPGGQRYVSVPVRITMSI